MYYFYRLVTLIFAVLFLGIHSVDAEAAFDHRYREWADVLVQYTADGFVDYASLKSSPESLEKALAGIEHVSKEAYAKWDEKEQIAFWLNAYNMATFKVVLDYYPLKKGLTIKGLAYPANSIQQIPDVWDRKIITIFGEKVSLNFIEHDTLREEFAEPRIHFALVCASVGCPLLTDKPFAAKQLDDQLSDQVRIFLYDTQKVRYDAALRVLYLSPIFKWFGGDFESTGGVKAFVRKHGPSTLADNNFERAQIRWLDYDWSLNGK